MSHDLVRQTTTTMTSPFTLAADAGFVAFAERYAVGAPIFVGLQGLDAQGVPVAQRCVGVGQLLNDGTLQIDSISAGSNGAALPAFACASIVVVDVMSIAALEALATARANAVVDGRITTRRASDSWSVRTCTGTPTSADQEFTPQATSGTIVAEAFNGWPVFSARAGAGASSGYGYRTPVANTPFRGEHMQQMRAALRSSLTDARTLFGVIDGPGTSGAAFFFTGLDAKGRVGNGTITETTPYTLTVGVFYVFEIEVAASGLSVTFRILYADTNVVLDSQTLTTNVPAVGLALFRWDAQGIFVVSPGAGVPALSISHMAYGTRPGYDAWRRGIA